MKQFYKPQEKKEMAREMRRAARRLFENKTTENLISSRFPLDSSLRINSFQFRRKKGREGASGALNSMIRRFSCFRARRVIKGLNGEAPDAFIILIMSWRSGLIIEDAVKVGLGRFECFV